MDKTKIREILSEQNISLTQVEIKDGDKEIEYNDIKVDMVKLGELFVKSFTEFYKCFEDSKDKEIKDLINKNKDICKLILEKSSYKFSNVNYGKYEKECHLRSYILDNYFEIIKFVDLYKELSE